MLQWRLLFLGVVTIHSLFASAELELAEGTDPLGGCDVGGQQYEVGEEVPDESGDPCVRCFCEDDGRVACAMTQCDWVRCVDSVRPEGACCPVCPNGQNCWRPGGVLKFGDEWQQRRGEFCTAICRCPSYSRYARCGLKCNFPENDDWATSSEEHRSDSSEESRDSSDESGSDEMGPIRTKRSYRSPRERHGSYGTRYHGSRRHRYGESDEDSHESFPSWEDSYEDSDEWDRSSDESYWD